MAVESRKGTLTFHGNAGPQLFWAGAFLVGVGLVCTAVCFETQKTDLSIIAACASLLVFGTLMLLYKSTFQICSHSRRVISERGFRFSPKRVEVSWDEFQEVVSYSAPTLNQGWTYTLFLMYRDDGPLSTDLEAGKGLAIQGYTTADKLSRGASELGDFLSLSVREVEK